MVRGNEHTRLISMRYDRLANAILSRLPDGPAEVAEIGCYRGDLSVRLLEGRANCRLAMVDPWSTPIKGSTYLRKGGNTAIAMLLDAEGLYQQVLWKTQFAQDRRTVIRSTSLAAAAMLPDNVFDLVFLDALHTYADVCDDLIAWFPKVRLGGWLSGHDYKPSNCKVQVKPAVDEFAAKHNFKVEIGSMKTWFIRVPPWEKTMNIPSRCVSFTLSQGAFLQGIGGFNMGAENSWKSEVQSVHEMLGKVVVLVRVVGNYPYMDGQLQRHAGELERQSTENGHGKSGESLGLDSANPAEPTSHICQEGGVLLEAPAPAQG